MKHMKKTNIAVTKIRSKTNCGREQRKKLINMLKIDYLPLW